MDAEQRLRTVPRDRPHVRRRGWVAWGTAAIVAAAIVGFAATQLAKTGAHSDALRSAFGFSIGDFAARSELQAKPAPDLSGPRLGGGTLSLRDYRGEVVVINLWASWCGPCRREQPEFERVWREVKGKPVQILGIDIRDQEAAARAFRDEFGVTYPSFADPSSQLAFKLKVQVLPSTFVIDRSGRIVFRLTGAVDAVLLRTVIDRALAFGEGAPRG